MRPILRSLLSTALAGAAVAASARAETVATVDGMAISREQVVQVLQKNPMWAQNQNGGDLALSALIDQYLLAKQGRSAGLAQTEAFKTAMEEIERELLAQSAAADYLKKHPITEQAIQARYDKIKANPPEKQYRVRHILLANQDAANEVLVALKKGENFSNLAMRSVDSATAARGGELGWQQPGSLTKPLMDAVEKLEPGQVAGPIELPNGWDVIQLLQVRKPELPPLDQLKSTIEAQLRNEAVQAYAQTLRQKADVKITATPKDKAGAK